MCAAGHTLTNIHIAMADTKRKPASKDPPLPLNYFKTHADVGNGGEESRQAQVENQPLDKELVFLEQPDQGYDKQASRERGRG